MSTGPIKVDGSTSQPPFALPVRHDAEHRGAIVDAKDEEIFVIDQWSEKSDLEVDTIAAFLVSVLNATEPSVITVIFGPPRSGKTFHAEKFAKLYGCRRIVEQDRRDITLKGGDLLLTWETAAAVHKRYRPEAEIRWIAIADAREAIGEERVYPG